MIVTSLNIRGLGGVTKSRYIRHLVVSVGVEVMCLQEKKRSHVLRCFSL